MIPKARLAVPPRWLPAALAATVIALAAAASPPAADDWTEFRGPGGRASARSARIPVRWEEGRGIAWTAELPGRGVSSPIVVGNRVVLTCNSGPRRGRLHVLCLDAADGRRVWERRFQATGQTLCHPKTCMAAATPASDGRRVYALFSCNDLVCLDLEGNLLWTRGLTYDYPNACVSVGMASSPVVAGKTLVVQVDTEADSFAVGLDRERGTNRWRIRRPRVPSWSSPLPFRTPDGCLQVLMQSQEFLAAYDPLDGKEIWRVDAPCGVIASAIESGSTLYVPSEGLLALKPLPSPQPPRELWRSRRLRSQTASPVLYEGRVLVLTASILRCADARSGDLLWQLRLKGPFSSTPVAAGGYLYAINEQGLCQVVCLGEKGQVAATHDFAETVLATPAIAGDAMFVRSDRHLWKIAGPRKRRADR